MKWANLEQWVLQRSHTVIDTFKNHYDTILNIFVNRATNANAESFNAKIKAFRAQFRGVTDIPFFLYKLMKLCVWGERGATRFYDWPVFWAKTIIEGNTFDNLSELSSLTIWFLILSKFAIFVFGFLFVYNEIILALYIIKRYCKHKKNLHSMETIKTKDEEVTCWLNYRIWSLLRIRSNRHWKKRNSILHINLRDELGSGL